MNWKWVFILLIFFLLIIFAVQNYEVVEIKFLVWRFSTSRAIVLFTTLIIGIAIGWILSLIRKR